MCIRDRYTSSNAKFAKHIDPNNKLLDDAIIEIKNKREKGLPTIPFQLGTEKNIIGRPKSKAIVN